MVLQDVQDKRDEQDQGVEQSTPAVRPLTGLALATAVVALAACGGGGADTAPPAGSNPPPAVPPTAKEASRFLQQSTFGATSAEITALQSKTLSSWINEQIALPRSQSHWDWLASKGYDSDAEKNNSGSWDASAWRKLITSEDQLRQRMAFALSQILVLSLDGVSGNWRHMATAAYADLLDEYAFGNFRDLLEKISLNVGMGIFLSHRGNQKENAATGQLPDENYAREVMQLFTIGLYELEADGRLKLNGGQPIETYDQADITGLARVFTGWDYDSTDGTTPARLRRPMALNANRHSSAAKVFLTASIPANTSGTESLRIAMDTLFNHPNVGPFIGKQLIQRLVTSNPSNAYVGRVAAAFNSSNGVRGDLAATLKAVLLDTEARDLSLAGYGKLSEPVLRLTQWARAFQASSPSGAWAIGNTSDAATRLGQSPMRSPSVFNFFRPGYLPPSTQIAQLGLVAPEFQITHESSIAGYLNYLQTVVGSGTADVKGSYDAWLAKVDQPAQLLAELNLLLAAERLSPANISLIQSAISSIATTTDTGRRNRLYAAIHLVMASPDYLIQK